MSTYRAHFLQGAVPAVAGNDSPASLPGGEGAGGKTAGHHGPSSGGTCGPADGAGASNGDDQEGGKSQVQKCAARFAGNPWFHAQFLL